MRILVESLKRLYPESPVTDDKLNTMLESGKITREEYDYIIGEETYEVVE